MHPEIPTAQQVHATFQHEPEFGRGKVLREAARPYEVVCRTARIACVGRLVAGGGAAPHDVVGEATDREADRGDRAAEATLEFGLRVNELVAEVFDVTGFADILTIE